MSERDWLTVREMADLAGVSIWAVRHWIVGGKLAAHRLTPKGRLRILKTDAANLLKGQPAYQEGSK